MSINLFWDIESKHLSPINSSFQFTPIGLLVVKETHQVWPKKLKNPTEAISSKQTGN